MSHKENIGNECECECENCRGNCFGKDTMRCCNYQIRQKKTMSHIDKLRDRYPSQPIDAACEALGKDIDELCLRTDLSTTAVIHEIKQLLKVKQ